MDTAKYHFLKVQWSFIIWDWESLEDTDTGLDNEAISKDESERPVDTDDDDDDEEEAEDHSVPAITYSVVFKQQKK